MSEAAFRALRSIIGAALSVASLTSLLPGQTRTAKADITVCNRGSVDLLVATVVVRVDVTAWYLVRPGGCSVVFSRLLQIREAFGLTYGDHDSWLVNLAFATRDSSSNVAPHLGLLDDWRTIPDGTQYRPRIVCLPYPTGSDDFTVRSRRGLDTDMYMPPCAAGVPIVPVSYSAWIEGERHEVVTQRPEDSD